MRKLLFLALVFIAANLLWGWLHIQLFQSPWPYLGWLSGALQATTLIFFPYDKVFKLQ